MTLDLSERPIQAADLAITASRFSPGRAAWSLAQVVLACLLAIYFITWVQDLKRISRLHAQPSFGPKTVISKYEAWDRVYRSTLIQPALDRVRTVAHREISKAFEIHADFRLFSELLEPVRED